MISLYALIRKNGYHTMRVEGKIRNQLVSILVDIGSTHNFVDQKVVKNIEVKLQSVTGLTVTVANGEKLKADEWCTSLTWKVQGLTQVVDFFTMPLRGCDVVLKV